MAKCINCGDSGAEQTIPWTEGKLEPICSACLDQVEGEIAEYFTPRRRENVAD